MKLTKERKRLVFLIGALVVLGGYSFYSNVLSGPSSPEPSRPSPAGGRASQAPASAPAYAEPQSAPRRPSTSGHASEEFRPSLKPKRPEDRVDPMTIDPTLRMDLLAKVQAVNIEGGRRNLFSAGAPPLPPEPVVMARNKPIGPMGPQPAPPPPQAVTPVTPPPPPINLKYYGYSSAKDNRKRAFFLDGDDILVAAEGETVKKRYRVVRIGVNSVVMEDTQFKHEQTLPLQEEAAG